MRKIEISAIYEKPEMHIVELVKIDIITESGGDAFPGEDDTFG